jgi:hypothetical protein
MADGPIKVTALGRVSDKDEPYLEVEMKIKVKLIDVRKKRSLSMRQALGEIKTGDGEVLDLSQAFGGTTFFVDRKKKGVSHQAIIDCQQLIYDATDALIEHEGKL